MQWSPKLFLFPPLAMLLACAGARADAGAEFASIDYALRFPAALAKFSPYADVAASGGASAGSRYGSAINPASLDWMPPPGAAVVLSPQVSRVGFQRGADLRIATVSASIGGAWGSLQPSYTRVTNDGAEAGDFLLTDGKLAQLQWGKRVDERLAVGVNVSRAEFTTRAGLGGMLAAEDNSASNSLRGGVLWAASERLMAGLVVDYTSGHGVSSLLDPDCFCVGQLRSSSRAATARIGLGYAYAPQSSLYADYLVGRYRNDAASAVSRSAMAGVEHLVLPWLYLRAGLAYDLRGTWGKSVGVGIMPSKTVSIDLAFQRDMFPELQPELGRATLANLSVSLAF